MADKHRRGKSGKRQTASKASGRPLPNKTAVLEFIQSAPQKVGKREIAKAFGIHGDQRVALKDMLREMANEGLIEGRRKNISRSGVLPAVAILEIYAIDDDGELIARPQKWTDENEPPCILVESQSNGRDVETAGIGDRVLAKIDPAIADKTDGYPYHARILKKLPREDRELLGVYRSLNDGSGIIDPIDRKLLREWMVPPKEGQHIPDGELVRFTPLRSRAYGPAIARITQQLGRPDQQKAISLIAIHRHNIPDHFPKKVVDELDTLPTINFEKRVDLRDKPLITIDPFDARDHDDAIFATRDTATDNVGGYSVIVAIADVAHYVRSGTALDREALNRGNSVYFPDRVVPMLPEIISNDLCSLRENEERPCLAVEIRFDKYGNKIAHKFIRAVMRSHAKLSYQQAQQAIDGHPDEITRPLLQSSLQPLWSAWKAIMIARTKRQPLDLDLPERKIIMNDEGRILDIVTPERLDAHRVVEEFMIQANVAAAETLGKMKIPLIYRVHAPPSFEKIQALADFLQTLEIKFPRNAAVRAETFNHILAKFAGSEVEQLVNETVLRSQSQAEYSVNNEGHFGLNLRHYAHFTSPIRRYADLMVHRALIKCMHWGEGGLTDEEINHLDGIASSISDLERRAMAAERETVDRLIAYHLADHIGASFAGRISGATKTGLFVRLNDTGADGFIPASTIGREYFYFDERHQALIGENTGETHHLGAPVVVRLVEAIPTAGALRFELLSKGEAKPKTAKATPRPPRKRKAEKNRTRRKEPRR